MRSLSNEDRRFYESYAIALIAIAAFLGSVQTIQFGVGLSKLGGHEHTWQVVLLSAVRSLAPAVNGSALMLALLLWSQRLAPAALARELSAKLGRSMLLSLAGYPVALLLLVGVSVPVASVLFEAPLGVLWPLFRVIGTSDLAMGYVATLVDALVIVLVTWRGLPRLHSSRLSLPAKIGVAWAVLFVIRSIVGLALPGGGPGAAG